MTWERSDAPLSLVDSLHELSAHHVTSLLEFLAQHRQLDMEDLPILDVPTPFRDEVLSTLGPLGGANSLCFTVVDTLSQTTLVLKAENLLSNPKYIEHELRRKLQTVPSMQDFIPANFFEKRARYFHHKYHHSMGRLIL
jgi:hypothetical protein